jgi:hypothetical protein
VAQDSSLGKKLAIGAAGLAHGVESTAGIVGDLEKFGDTNFNHPEADPDHFSIGGLGNLITNPNIDWNHPYKAPTQEALAKQGTALSTSDIDNTIGDVRKLAPEPTTAGDKAVAGISEGIGAGLGGGGVTGLVKGGTKAALAGAAAGGAEGAGGAAAVQALPEDAPEWAKLGAGLAGGVATHGVGSIVSNWKQGLDSARESALAQADLRSAQAEHDAALAAAKEGPNSPDYQAKVELAAQAENDLAHTKTAADLANKQARFAADSAHQQTVQDALAAQQNRTTAANNSIEDVASAYGGARTPQQAGEAMQDAARAWRYGDGPNTMNGRLASTWAPIDEIGQTAPAGVANLEEALNGINSQAGDLEPVNNLLKPGLPRTLQNRLDDILHPPLDEHGNPPEGWEPPEINWNTLRTLRSNVGEALSNPQVVDNIGKANLKRIYAALSDDMRDALGAVNEDAPQMFDQANREAQRIYDTASGPVAKIISGPRPSVKDAPGEVPGKFLKANDGYELNALGQEIPAAVDHLGAYALRADPRAFANMEPEVQEQLIPHAEHRDAVLGAVQELEAAPRDSANAVAQSQELRDRIISQARLKGSLDKNNASSALRASKQAVAQSKESEAQVLADVAKRAKERLAAAQAGVAPAEPPPGLTDQSLVKAMKRLGLSYELGDIGGSLGERAGNALGAGIPGFGTAGRVVGTSLGLALPGVARGVRDTITDPGALRAAGRGARPLTIHGLGQKESKR